MRLLSVDARVTGRDRGALARLIESAQADIACVHHGPHLLRWRSINAAIGRRCGLVTVAGGRTAGANLLLCSLGVDSSRTEEVRLADGGSRLLPAGAAVALLRHGGVDFVLAAANLIGNAADRITQARDLQRTIEAMSPGRAPVIAAVQGVDRAGTGAWQTVLHGAAGSTSPDDAERVAVAGRVFVDHRITVGECHDLDGYADTALPPITVDLDLTAS